MKLIKLLPMVIGLVLLVVGLALMYFPPKEINGFYGYRTQRSYSSQRCWDFAQKYSAKVMVVSSLLLLAICGAVCYVEQRSNVNDLVCVAVNAVLMTMLSFVEIAVVICLTERALSKL